METTRDTYKYHLLKDGRPIHSGVTSDWQRRELELRERFPGSQIEVIGKRTTRKEALKWLRKQHLNVVR